LSVLFVGMSMGKNRFHQATGELLASLPNALTDLGQRHVKFRQLLL
jgi:hypothetical protein